MTSQELRFLADAIQARRISWPPDEQQLRAIGVIGNQDECWTLLAGAAAGGASAELAGWFLRRFADERLARETTDACVQPVITGPCAISGLRATEDAFREVIDQAVRKLLITGFALHNGRTILQHLASRMDALPGLEAWLCLDISRAPGDSTEESAIIAAFAERFRRAEWPGHRLPRLYFDPRSLTHGMSDRSVLHAKVAIADTVRALVGSANLTDAALKRNIEVGVLLSTPTAIAALKQHFESLIHTGVLAPVPL